MAYAAGGPVRPRVEWHEIPDGDAGIEATVVHMRRLARAGSREPPVRQLAAELAGRDDHGTALAIRAFLAGRVRFEPDPAGLELIRSPTYLIDDIERAGHAVGDCDDVAVLGAAVGMAAGLRARYVLVGFRAREPFEHVYTELITRHGPVVELDITRPAQFPPGLVIRRLGYREA